MASNPTLLERLLRSVQKSGTTAAAAAAAVAASAAAGEGGAADRLPTPTPTPTPALASALALPTDSPPAIEGLPYTATVEVPEAHGDKLGNSSSNLGSDPKSGVHSRKESSEDSSSGSLAGRGAAAPAPLPQQAPATGRCKSLGRELGVLFWRSGTDFFRNPSLLLLHWAMAIGAGLLMGVIYWCVLSMLCPAELRMWHGAKWHAMV